MIDWGKWTDAILIGIISTAVVEAFKSLFLRVIRKVAWKDVLFASAVRAARMLCIILFLASLPLIAAGMLVAWMVALLMAIVGGVLFRSAMPTLEERLKNGRRDGQSVLIADFIPPTYLAYALILGIVLWQLSQVRL